MGLAVDRSIHDRPSLPPCVQTNARDLEQLVQDGIRDVLGGSQGSLLPIPSLNPGAARGARARPPAPTAAAGPALQATRCPPPPPAAPIAALQMAVLCR